jgi:hypothetical protein
MVRYKARPAGSPALSLRPPGQERAAWDGGVYLADPRREVLDRRFALVTVTAVTYRNLWDLEALLHPDDRGLALCPSCAAPRVVEVWGEGGGIRLGERHFASAEEAAEALAAGPHPDWLVLHPEGMSIEDVAWLCDAGRAQDCGVLWEPDPVL